MSDIGDIQREMFKIIDTLGVLTESIEKLEEKVDKIIELNRAAPKASYTLADAVNPDDIEQFNSEYREQVEKIKSKSSNEIELDDDDFS